MRGYLALLPRSKVSSYLTKSGDSYRSSYRWKWPDPGSPHWPLSLYLGILSSPFSLWTACGAILGSPVDLSQVYIQYIQTLVNRDRPQDHRQFVTGTMWAPSYAGASSRCEALVLMDIHCSSQSTVVGLVAGPAVSLLALIDLREGAQAVVSISASGRLRDP